MTGVHDLGGREGFGPVRPEPDEPVFHAEWEARVLALVLAIGALGRWNIDQNRHSRECLPPETYLGSSYYRIWFLALQRNLVASRLLVDGATAKTWDEIEAGLRQGTPYDRPAPPPRFAVGDRVRTRTLQVPGHTRLPRYARGRVGTIVRHHGGHVFPDTNAVPVGATGADEGQHLYTVEFCGRDLWGPDTDPAIRVSIDAFEPYLEPVATSSSDVPWPADVPKPGGHLFSEPWHARVFALAVDLHERGTFTWPEFAAALAHRIAASDDPTGADYYPCWYAALTDLLGERDLLQ